MINQLRTLATRFSRNVPATQQQLTAVNSLLSTYCADREERLLLLGYFFDRDFRTSKDLSKGEASAIIELAYSEKPEKAKWVHDMEFVQFLEEAKVNIYAF